MKKKETQTDDINIYSGYYGIDMIDKKKSKRDSIHDLCIRYS